jgi:DNA polymerase I-like protein with 3'-5' exonuclease and polymerase domains
MRVSNDTLHYNALDAIGTLMCADSFFPEVAKHGFLDTYNHTIDLYAPLMYMQGRGVKVDSVRLKETSAIILKRMQELQEKIDATCKRHLNPLSSPDCQKYFYIEKGIQPYTKRGPNNSQVVTCDDKALTRIARGTGSRRGYPEASFIQRYRGYNKLRGTYLEINFDQDGRLRCSYNPRGTKFGRLSSSETIFETGTNMQNLPEEFKSFLVADDLSIFIEIDKSQAEWVVVAYDSGDEAMIKAIEDGKDVHAYTASRMFGVPESVVKQEDEIVGHNNDPDIITQLRSTITDLRPYLDRWLPRTMSMRQCGKKSNHGLNYDETFRMFSLINEITEKESKIIIDFYHGTYPGIKRWHERTKNQLQQGRVLTNCFGRKCRFLNKWGDDLFKAAYSYNPQSTVGELVNRGIVLSYNDPSECLARFEGLAQTHDSYLLQSELGNWQEMAEGILRVKAHLSPVLACHGREFVIKNDVKIGLNWGSNHPEDNPEGMLKVKLVEDKDQLAANLEKTYNELKKTKRLDISLPGVHG